MPPLREELILDEAQAMLAESDNPEISMRALAKRLNVTPMALYRYFRNRDDLLAAVAGRIASKLEFPSRDIPPAQRAVMIAESFHEMLVNNPFMIGLIPTGRAISSTGLAIPRHLIECAQDAGLSDQRAFLFYRSMFSAILGQATFTVARLEHGADTPRLVSTNTTEESDPGFKELSERWTEHDENCCSADVFTLIAQQLGSS